MRIVVCVKHVPDAESDRRIEDGLVVRGEDDMLNELDEHAIEAAVSLVEDMGGEVIALTMGPDDAEEAVRRALQLGADRGVVISDDGLEGSDALGTAQVLAAGIRTLIQDGTVDMVLAGMSSLDGMTAMLPGALAQALQWPSLTLADTLTIDGSAAVISRSADGFNDVLEAPLPVVVSVTDQVNEPRFPNFKDMAAARKKKVDFWDLSDVGIDDPETVNAGFENAGMRVVAAKENEGRTAGRIITDPDEAVTELVAYLKENVR